MEWKDRNLTIIPVRYKDVSPYSLRCLMGLFDVRTMKLDSHWADGMMSRTRNLIVTRAFFSGAQWFLLLEDEIVYPNGKKDWAKHTTIKNPEKYNYNIIDRLLSHQKTLICPNEGQVRLSQKLIENGECSSKCVFFHRSVLEAIIKKYEQQKDFMSHNDHDGIRFFTQDAKKKVSKNPYDCFIEKAREVGHNLFVDSGCRIFVRKDGYE